MSSSDETSVCELLTLGLKMNSDEDLSTNYSVSKWWRWVRSGIGNQDVSADTKARQLRKLLFANSVIFLILGSLQVTVYWESFYEWWKITTMTFEEVKDTPYRKLWTSGRGAMGFIFLFCGIIIFIRALTCKVPEKPEPNKSALDNP